MRHLKSGRKLSRRKGHRDALLSNLAASVIKHERVHTTDAKAKEVRPFLEKLVTFARRGDLHARRIVLSRLRGDVDAVKKLFDEIAPRFSSRPGGYTRILKLGFRQGDNSPMSLLEFVGEEAEKKAVQKPKTKKAAKPAAKATAAKEAVEAAAPAAAETAEAAPEAAGETADAASETTEDVAEAPADEQKDAE